MDTAPARPHKHRWWIKLSWALVPLLCLLIVAAAFNAYGSKQLARAIQEARRQGQPLTYDEINAERRVWAPEEDGGKIVLDLKARFDELSKADHDNVPLLEGDLPPLGHRWTDEQLAASATVLQDTTAELAKLNEIRRFSGGSLPLVIAENPIDTLLPSLSHVRLAVKLKALELVYGVMSGDSTGVESEALIMTRLGNLLSDHPTLISSLVQVACDSLTVSTIEQACGLTSLTPEQLSSLERILEGQEAIDSLRWGLLGERAMFLGTAEYVLKGGQTTGLPEVLAIPGLKGFLRQDVAVGLRLHNRVTAALADPQGRLEAMRKIEAEMQSLPGYYLYTRTVFPSMTRAMELGMLRLAELRCARAGLAAERYRLATGQLPGSFSDLVPAYMKEAPIDPFADKPVLFKATEQGIVIYSTGTNAKDDGGDVVRTGRRPRRQLADIGFTLLKPEQRNLPPVPPETAPAGSRPR